MALNFPNEPVLGEIFEAENMVFVWNGTVWTAVPAGTNNGVPLGTVMYFAGLFPPNGWLVCDGSAVSEMWPDLRTELLNNGSPFGEAGGHPLLPDLRGEFIRGLDKGRGIDAGRVLGALQLDQLQKLTGAVADVQFLGGAGSPTIGILNRGAAVNSGIWAGSTNVARNTRLTLDTSLDPTVRSGAETRPRNVALLPCMKASNGLNNSDGSSPPQPVTIVQGASGWQVVGDQLICWGFVVSNASGVFSIAYPRAFKAIPAVVTNAFSNTGARRGTHMLAITTADASGVALIETGAGAAMSVSWIAIGEALDADKKPKVVGGAGGAAGADFATLPEALAGVRPDAVMSPALVRALSGVDGPRAMTGTQVTFGNVPLEANEIDILLAVNYPAGGTVTFDFAG
jgi:Phage Tail Collar Domain